MPDCNVSCTEHHESHTSFLQATLVIPGSLFFLQMAVSGLTHRRRMCIMTHTRHTFSKHASPTLAPDVTDGRFTPRTSARSRRLASC